jgi:hypothetical protein
VLGKGHGNISHAPFFVKRSEIMVCFLICMLSIPNSEGMKNLKVDEDYTSFFKANPSLLSEPGVKVIQTPGETKVISIGYAEIKTKNSVGKLNAEKIATMKARASIVGDRKGIRVYEKKELVENSQVVKENGIEKGKSVSELTQVNEETISGAIKGSSVVARWVSEDDGVLFVAVLIGIAK